MMKLSAAVASLAVANAMSESERNNMCYDFWNQIEEAGIKQYDELNANVGANINGGSLTAVGTGAAVNGGRLNFNHIANGGDFDPDTPLGTAGASSLNANVGANVGLAGSTATNVGSGVGLTLANAISNINLYKGNYNVPGLPGAGYTGGAMSMPAIPGQGGIRRRLMMKECGPPPATGGSPVTCASTGDPHIQDFRGDKFDHMAFGEFVFYNAWEPFSHHPQTDLKIHVRNGPFQGRSQTISSNQGVAIGGRLACFNKYEIHKANNGVVSKLKITRRNGQETNFQGRDQIYQALSRETCPEIKIENNVAHFVFEEKEGGDRTTLRVQIVTYGINLGLDVLGETYRKETDRGICTKNAGWDMQLDCSHSLFTMYPGGRCENLQRGGHRGGPAVECPTRLFQQAEAVCNKCPETVNPKGCTYDICALGDISFKNEILQACNVGVRLPARMTVNTGVNINMAGATAFSVGRGVGVNHGITNVNVHE